MVNQQLIDWIKKAKECGHSQDIIYNALIKQGHSHADITEALNTPLQTNTQLTTKVNLPKILIFSFIGILVLGLVISIISSQEKNVDYKSEYSNNNSEYNLKPYCKSSQEKGIVLKFCSNKSIYELQENTSFDISMDYQGEKKEIAIFIKKERINYDKVFYDYYTANLTKEGIKYNSAKFGDLFIGDRIAFTVTETSSSGLRNSFIYEGEYNYSVYLYDCEDLLAYGIECGNNGLIDLNKTKFQSLFFWKEVDYENMILRVPRMLDLKMKIFVQGGSLYCTKDKKCTKSCDLCNTGSFSCTSDFECVQCKSKKDCIAGYDCRWGKCLPDSQHCEDSSDCDQCDNCAPNAAQCKNNKCNYCSVFSGDDRSCMNGASCEKWGCVGLDILSDINSCEGGCGTSEFTITQDIGCTMSSNTNKNLKCFECSNDLACKSGYHCYNYKCVAD